MSLLSSIPNECEFLKPVSEDIFTKTVTHLFSYYEWKCLRNAIDASRTAITQTDVDYNLTKLIIRNYKTIDITTLERLILMCNGIYLQLDAFISNMHLYESKITCVISCNYC